MILDTNAVSALLAGDAGLEQVLAASDRHHLPLVVIGQYRFGLLGSRKRKSIERWFERLIKESTVLFPDLDTADHYAAVRHDLKRRGRPIPENDVWIAALALQHAFAIVSRDLHFDAVPGVRRVAWQRDATGRLTLERGINTRSWTSCERLKNSHRRRTRTETEKERRRSNVLERRGDSSRFLGGGARGVARSLRAPQSRSMERPEQFCERTIPAIK